MFHADPKLIAQLSTHLGRVLIVDPYEAHARATADMIRALGAGQVEIMEQARAAYERAETYQPDLILTEVKGPGVDGVLLTRKLRRSNFGCRRNPVIVTAAEATAQGITATRDAGAHEFLRKPFSALEQGRRTDDQRREAAIVSEAHGAETATLVDREPRQRPFGCAHPRPR